MNSNASNTNHEQFSVTKTRENNDEYLSGEEKKTKLYRKRWPILFLFLLLSVTNNFQWSEYTIIENILMSYYNVSSLTIEGTALTFNIMTIVLSVPACIIIKRLGVRISVIICTLGTALGSWIKWVAVIYDQIIILYVGQVFVSSCQIFTSTLPSQIAAFWFGSNEIGQATSLAKAGTAIGIAIGTLTVPMIVVSGTSSRKFSEIHYELSYLHLGIAIVCTIIALISIIFFEQQPKLPPCESRATQQMNDKTEEIKWKSMKDLMKNYSFVLLLNSYGIDIGILVTFINLLNPILIAHFPKSEKDAGNIGMLIFIVGSIISLISCRIVDKTKKFKTSLIVVKTVSLIIYLVSIVFVYLEYLWALYVFFTIAGTFQYCVVAIGLEYRAEITYPEMNVSVIMMNFASHLYTLIFLPICSMLLDKYTDFSVHAFYCIIVTFSLFLLIFTKEEFKRQEANQLKEIKKPYRF